MEQAWNLYFIIFLSFFHLSPPHVSSSQGNQQVQFSSLEEWRIIIHGHIIIEKRKARQPYSFPPSVAWTCQQQSKGNSREPDHIRLSFPICASCERYAVRGKKQIKYSKRKTCIVHPPIYVSYPFPTSGMQSIPANQ